MGVFEDYEKAVLDVEYNNCTLEELKEAEQRLKDSLIEWIPVTERLPEKVDSYFVTVGSVPCFDWAFWNGCEWEIDCERIEGVTAWMPLPKPYEEGAEMKGGA